MLIRCAVVVEVDASRWDEDKGSDARNADNEWKTRQRSTFDMRDIFTRQSSSHRRELGGIWPCPIRGGESFLADTCEERIFSYEPRITIKDFKNSQSRFVACSGVG